MNNNLYFSINIPEPYSSDGYNCEYEVSKDAIKYYQKFYSIYNRDEYSIIKDEDRRINGQRRQMSKPGDCLIKKSQNGEYSLDIVGDILTSIGHIKKEIRNEKEDYLLFEKIYHSYGNLLPCCEGINIRWGKPKDNYYTKLVNIKRVFDNNANKKEIDIVKNKIKQKELLGNGISNLGCLKYWIVKDYIEKNRDWKNFVDMNFLQDYVDNEYNILNVPESLDYYLKFLIDRIIMRQYRIENNKEISKETLEKVKSELRFSYDFSSRFRWYSCKKW